MANSIPEADEPSSLQAAWGKALNQQLDAQGFPRQPKRLVHAMERLQMSRTQTYRILKGESLPGLETMLRLRSLGVSFDEVLDWIGRPHVAIVDDDAPTLASLAQILESRFRVSSFQNAEQLLAELEHRSFDAFVLDWQLHGLAGAAMINRVRTAAPRTPIYLLTGQAAAADVADAIAEADVIYGQKPVAPEILVSAISNAVKKAARGVRP